MSAINPPDSELMGYVIRMVIPLKREFGRVLDVNQFLQSRPYAAEVIEQALTSRDERLQNYANYVQGKLLGPRTTNAPRLYVPIPASSGESLIQAAIPSTGLVKKRDSADSTFTKEEKEVLARYKTGLR